MASRKNRILKEVHESARGLHGAGQFTNLRLCVRMVTQREEVVPFGSGDYHMNPLERFQ